MRRRGIPAPKPARKPAKQADPTAAPRSRHHPLYGDIPLLPRSVVHADKTYTYWDPDPLWQPELPAGAVRGNPRDQVFCGMCHDPHYFYLDEPRRCVQCGQDFLFRAAEQKFWYETLKFNFHSTAIRCPACRRQRRSLKALLHGIQSAAARLAGAAADPLAQLAYAEALIAYHARCGKGDLDKAVAACRRARKLEPRLSESLYWEAEAHWLEG
ncbi:MAG TPA: zinc-ribbon domain-containing protein, partial [Candidatus Obscuribacterales bacterium]